MTTDHPLKGRKQNPEHVARRARKCESGCTCKRHTSQLTPEAREKQRQATLKKWESGVYEGRAEKTSATWASKSPEELAEFSRKQSEARKREWAANPRRNRHYGTRKRTSKHELALVPYMKALGYQHDTGKRIGHKIPDFVDESNKRVYEYFGTYWHPDRTEEQKVVEHYALRGWECKVLWEDNLYEWLLENSKLVSREEHEKAWEAAHVNNGYKKPPM